MRPVLAALYAAPAIAQNISRIKIRHRLFLSSIETQAEQDLQEKLKAANQSRNMENRKLKSGMLN